MNLLICIFIFSVLVMNSEERLLVSGSSRSISASVGEDVTLNCSVDSHITTEHIEEVSWKKTDGDEDIMVLLYQNNQVFPDSSDERYRDRVEFFTDEIPKGNFSFRLKSVRTEDKGVYMCQVFAGGLSANATVVLKRLGFSVSHILVFIICITASVSALLPCCLIYCRCCNFSNTQCQVVQYNCGFTVIGPYGCHMTLGDSVVLPCYVDKCLLKEEGLKVEWRRTDSETLVHLYEDGESRPEAQHQDYQDRAHFFTDQIQHGNFSLRLDNLRAEDKGLYRCKVYSGQGFVYSAEADLTLSFTVRSASKFQFVPVGGSVVLPCHVDKCLLKEEGLKVEWKRTTGDSETLVHLYEDGESRAEAQHQDYHDRAHFFTDQIQHGNFSLQLEKVRAEDDGQYICKVYSGQDCVYSTSTKLILRFTIKRSCHTPAPLGSSVVLPCYVDKPLPTEGLKVEWRRTDSETLVHLCQPEQQDENDQDRAHFFTDQIQHGNFSLRLYNLRAEDEGKYTCTVYRNQRQVFSVNKILELRLVDTVFNLQMFLVVCPNILMFLAFVFWGVSEGSLFESASCCALYFLRPLMLLWAAPYVNNFTGNIKTFIHDYSYETEYIVFSAIFYSVLFKSAWDKSLNYTGFEGAMIIVLFVTVLLLNLFYIIYLLAKLFGKLSKRIIALFKVMARIIFDFLPSLQFILLFFAFGSARGGFFIVAVLPVFLTVTRYNWDLTCGEEMGCSPSVRRSVWFILMLLVSAIIVYFYIIALENEKDHAGWACMIGFLQLLWAVINFTRSFDFALHRVVPVYLFGSVGVVLLNAVTLMAELILKTVNGDGAVGDLRVVVFSSECLFTLFLMILLVFEPWIKTCLQSCQNASGSDETPANESNQNTTESHEMKPLLNEDQEAGRNDMTEENQPDSVETQT